jgi:hypothetical protein
MGIQFLTKKKFPDTVHTFMMRFCIAVNPVQGPDRTGEFPALPHWGEATSTLQVISRACF